MSEAQHDVELAELERDRRSERRLVLQAAIALVVVGLLVALREWLLR